MHDIYGTATWLADQFTEGTATDTDRFVWAGRAAQPISKIDISSGSDDHFNIWFEGVGALVIADRGQSCCEHRYITCDDDLSSFVGARLVGIDLEAGRDSIESEYGEPHEQQFVKVSTTNGDFTVCTHNEHNGYYGGFNLKLEWVDAE